MDRPPTETGKVPAQDVAPQPTTSAPPKRKFSGLQFGVRLVLTIVLVASMWVFWIIFLAGVGAGQAACKDSGVAFTSGGNLGNAGGTGGNNNPNTNIDINDLINQARGRRLLSSSEEGCRQAFSYPFWLVFNQMIINIVALVLMVIPWAQKNFVIPAIALFTMETALLMQLCGDLNSAIYALKDAEDDNLKKSRSAAQCAMAGAIVLTLINFVYILGTGSNIDMLKFSFWPVEEAKASKDLENGATTPAYPQSPAPAGATVLHVSPEGPPATPIK